MGFESLKEKFNDFFDTEKEESSRDVLEDLEIVSGSTEIVDLPDVDNVKELDISYPLIKPFTEAHIFWDEEEETIVYEIEEPKLSEYEEEVFTRIKRAMERKIDVSLRELDSTDKIVKYLGKKIQEVAKELGVELSDQNMKKLMYFIYRDFAGLNELEPLMHDPYIEDIGVSGINIPTYVVHSKYGSIRSRLIFKDSKPLKNLVVKLAERAGKYVSYADPLLDGSLPDGSRVNASLTEDVTTKGPTISIRKFQETPYSAIDLIRFGTVDYRIMAYFWLAMQYEKSILIAGGTATGKTTFLNSIVTFIPPEQKIVSIEDTRELKLPHENWIPSVSRTSFGMGADTDQDIGMYQLLKESFRQNPDYVVVGEVRGEEASVLFQGMSSGHPSMGTIHASSPKDVVKRLTTPPIDLSPSLVETLDIVIISTRARQYGESARRLKGVYEVETITDEGSPRTNQYVSWTPIDDTYALRNDSNVFNEIRRQFGYTEKEMDQEIKNRIKVLKWMDRKDLNHFSEVAKVVSEYYSDKELVVEAAEKDLTLEELEKEKEEEKLFEEEGSPEGVVDGFDEGAKPDGKNVGARVPDNVEKEEEEVEEIEEVEEDGFESLDEELEEDEIFDEDLSQGSEKTDSVFSDEEKEEVTDKGGKISEEVTEKEEELQNEDLSQEKDEEHEVDELGEKLFGEEVVEEENPFESDADPLTMDNPFGDDAIAENPFEEGLEKVAENPFE